MEWFSIQDGLPMYEKYVIIWHDGLKVSRSSFYNGEDKWVNFKTPGFEVQYYDPEDITHWMYWPDQPKELYERE